MISSIASTHLLQENYLMSTIQLLPEELQDALLPICGDTGRSGLPVSPRFYLLVIRPLIY